MRTILLTILGLALAALQPTGAEAGCGCDKPPPPRAVIRPFVAHVDQMLTVFDDRVVPGAHYDVLFESTDGSADWSRGKGVALRDFADGQVRPQVKVRVGDVGMGPCRVTVYQQGAPLLQVGGDQFTVAGRPVVLHDFRQNLVLSTYRAGVGSDGTVYIQITAGSGLTSSTFGYWRHEFRTYKAAHRQIDAWSPDDSDPNWHANGTYHVDHDHLVIAIRGTLPDGSTPAPGVTAPFRLVIGSVGGE